MDKATARLHKHNKSTGSHEPCHLKEVTMNSGKILTALLACSLVACGSDSNSSDSPAPAVDNRLVSNIECQNTITKARGHFRSSGRLGSISPSGVAIFMDSTEELAYAGCLSESGNTLSGRLTIYGTENNSKVASGVLNATIDETIPDQPRISGTLTVDGEQYPINESYDPTLSNQSDAIQPGNYDDGADTPSITATVSATNELVLTDGNLDCQLRSAITRPDSSLNIHVLARISSTCKTVTTEYVATGFVVRFNGGLYITFANNNFISAYFLSPAGT